MLLIGRVVKLRPMTLSEKGLFFDMATRSDATPYLYGPLSGTAVPTWEELFRDYQDYFFDGSQPEKGRCFAILSGDRVIGQVSYNEIDRQRACVELDVWIAASSDTGKGAGPDALETLMRYLHEEMSVGTFVICPSAANPRAIRAYQKAGFRVASRSTDSRGKDSYRMEEP